MLKFFARRLVGLVLIMLTVSFLIFLTFEFSPGDVARSALGQFATHGHAFVSNPALQLHQAVSWGGI